MQFPFITTVLRVCWKICCHLDPFQKYFLGVSSSWPCSIQGVASWHPHTKMVSRQGGFCSHLFSIEHLSMSLLKKKDKRQKTNKRKKLTNFCLPFIFFKSCGFFVYSLKIFIWHSDYSFSSFLVSQLLAPNSPLPPPSSTPSLFLFTKRQTSYGYQPNMSYQLAVRLSTSSHTKVAGQGDPV